MSDRIPSDGQLDPAVRRTTLRCRIAGSLLLALLALGQPLVRVVPGLHLGPAPALADEGGSDGGGGGGGDGGHDGSGGGSGGDDGGGSGGDDGGGSSGDDGGASGSDGESGDDNGQDGEAGDESSGGGGGAEGAHRAVEHELVVVGPAKDLQQAVAPLGMRVAEETPFAALGLSVARVALPQGMSLAQGKALLEARVPGIQVDVNALYSPMASLSLPPADYGPQMIGWTKPPAGCGKGIRLGMIDTGVDTRQPALATRHIRQKSFLAPGAVAAPLEHGTAIAGILVGAPVENQMAAASGGEATAADVPSTGAGLLPEAELYAASIFSSDAAGQPQATALAFVGALDWLVGAGVRAINVSLAGEDNLLMDLAVKQATERGAVLAAAAGNGGPGAPPAYPAALGPVIAVTAVDADGRLYDQANRGDYIDVAAPGVRVHSPAAPGSGFETGTSFAAPFVTAVLAARIAAGAPDDAKALHALLAETSRDLGPPGRDPEFGWGLVQSKGLCGAG
ncbi:MAG: S8 family serine peptidase [Pseudomonadota bacterium]